MRNTQSLSVGVFENLETAEQTIDELRRHGFRDDEIGVIGHVGEEMQDTVPTPLGLKAPEWNAIAGMSAGAAYGAIIGTMVALVVPLVATATEWGRWFDVSFGALLGALLGGVLLAFGGLFFSRRRGRFYEDQLVSGRFIVTVKSPARHKEALDVLRQRAVDQV